MANKTRRSGQARRGTVKKAAPRPAGNSELRKQLADFMGLSHAHVSWKNALAGVPEHIRGIKPAGSPYSLWQVLEHMRLAQWDILEFSRDPKHVSPDWPAGYWPSSDAPASDRDWQNSLRGFERDLGEMRDLVLNPKTDLYAKIPHGTGQTILREALLVADHNAYHLGQFVLLRRLLNAWPAEWGSELSDPATDFSRNRTIRDCAGRSLGR